MERHEDDINNLCSHYVDLDNYLDVKHKLCEHLDIAIQFYDGLLKDAKLVSSVRQIKVILKLMRYKAKLQ